MGSVTDLLNFRGNDLFPDETIVWGCEINKDKLINDEKSGKSYYMNLEKRVYCEFSSREEMEYSLKRKRVSLKRAIEVYMEEGTMSISDVSLPAGEAGCQSRNPEYQSETTKPSWNEMTNNPKRFHVIFDMLEDLKGAIHGGIDIPKSMSRIVQFSQGKWYTTNGNGEFHLYDGFNNGGSGDKSNKKISIFGLVLQYDESEGSLTLNQADYAVSQRYFPELSELLKGRQLARVEWPTANSFTERNQRALGHLPCNLQWSNGLRFDPSDRDGKCLHFTASTKGALYVVFSAVPSNKDTWYYVEISPFGVAIYKSQRLKVSTVNTNAVALGDALLYQSYFVCVTESTTSTVIEYGKSQGTTDSGDVYLTMIDHDQPLHVRFYSFANGEESAQIVDSHVVSRKLTTSECKGDTYRDKEEPNCVQRCHEACAPLTGCKSRSQGNPKASECNECRYAKDQSDVCITECPAGQKPNKQKNCMESFDLKFKQDTGLEHSDITGFPTLNEMAICFWINTQGAEDRNDFALDYVNKGAAHTLFQISVTVSDEVHIDYYIGEKGKEPRGGRFLKFKKDDKWHLFCVNRESSTGIISLFIDGKNAYPTFTLIEQPGRVPEAGGTMHLGGFRDRNFRGKISGVNIWNRL
ncbi:uncharacterized protein LOC116292780 [Actinia tenebrosa]|uniref:Uncharacterized protein LOC116292780 n=1 Tax=Actinia tenebrosa TaxID=6105 RepID=A0A6P8HTI2_ACTTE|nr:uncharacterized protein LOC116292780 [Actinia tenebrosa]